jgi:hypothetical protein
MLSIAFERASDAETRIDLPNALAERMAEDSDGRLAGQFAITLASAISREERPGAIDSLAEVLGRVAMKVERTEAARALPQGG